MIGHACPECKGNLEQKNVTHDLRFRGELYSFQNVPARLCGSCGATYLDASTVKLIEAAIVRKKEPEQYSKVPVFLFEGLGTR